MARPTIVIDRPEGTVKEWSGHGKWHIVSYPMDYGYVEESWNPQDDARCDVFVGHAPEGEGLYGRFHKGQNWSGEWRPDEHKWFVRCTPKDVEAIHDFYGPDVVRDVRFLPGDLRRVLHDMKLHCQRTRNAVSASIAKAAMAWAQKCMQAGRLVPVSEMGQAFR